MSILWPQKNEAWPPRMKAGEVFHLLDDNGFRRKLNGIESRNALPQISMSKWVMIDRNDSPFLMRASHVRTMRILLKKGLSIRQGPLFRQMGVAPLTNGVGSLSFFCGCCRVVGPWSTTIRSMTVINPKFEMIVRNVSRDAPQMSCEMEEKSIWKRKRRTHVSSVWIALFCLFVKSILCKSINFYS